MKTPARAAMIVNRELITVEKSTAAVKVVKAGGSANAGKPAVINTAAMNIAM